MESSKICFKWQVSAICNIIFHYRSWLDYIHECPNQIVSVVEAISTQVLLIQFPPIESS